MIDFFWLKKIRCSTFWCTKSWHLACLSYVFHCSKLERVPESPFRTHTISQKSSHMNFITSYGNRETGEMYLRQHENVIEWWSSCSVIETLVLEGRWKVFSWTTKFVFHILLVFQVFQFHRLYWEENIHLLKGCVIFFCLKQTNSKKLNRL